MKNYISILVLLTTGLAFSQVELEQSEIQTSDIEYQFLTEEYGSKNNFSMLEGYHLETFKKIPIKQFEYDFQFFIQNNTNDIKAIFIKITKEKRNDDKLRYLCLPINNDKLFKKFTTKYDNLGLNIGDYFEEIVTYSVENYITQFYNSNKKDVKTNKMEYEFLNTKYNSSENIEILDGYELKPFFNIVVEEMYNYNYNLFIETKTKNVKAILIEITKLKKGENKIRHLVVPLNNKELYIEFKKDELKKLGVNMWFYFGVSKIALHSKIIDNLYNIKKVKMSKIDTN